MENKEINLLTTLKKQEYGSNSNAESCIGRKTAGIDQLVINKVQRMVEGKRQGVMETIARLLDEGK